MPGLVRVDAEDREHLVVPVGELERATAAGDVGADREDPRHAGVARPRDDVASVVVERVEVRVRVDHALPLHAERASSSAAVSGGSLRKSGFGSRSTWPGASSLGAHEPTQLS